MPYMRTTSAQLSYHSNLVNKRAPLFLTI